MGPGDLAAALGDSGLRVVDCRFDLLAPDAGREAYLQGHIPGAVYADLDRDLSGPVVADSGRHPLPAIEAAEAAFSRLGIDSATTVVAYDAAGGAIAARAWWLLRWLGHPDVRVLDGGLQAWLARGLPTESGPQEHGRRDFRASEVHGRVLATSELEIEIAAARPLRLVDARDAPRFRGESEPIDSRAGHIPGTCNLPYTDCLRQDGTWLDREALRRLLEPLLGEDGRIGWAAMCGSGVTACHLAISGLLAGYSEPRIYVGSWSEWIRDPARPIAEASAK